MKILDQLRDYNTPLSNDDRDRIAEVVGKLSERFDEVVEMDMEDFSYLDPDEEQLLTQ